MVTSNVYHPSSLKVPGHEEINGVPSVPSDIDPLSQAPFKVSEVAVAHVAP